MWQASRVQKREKARKEKERKAKERKGNAKKAISNILRSCRGVLASVCKRVWQCGKTARFQRDLHLSVRGCAVTALGVRCEGEGEK